jgi:uncharacterized protein YrrD
MAAFDFRMGAQVHCTDGSCGKLVKLVLDPQTQQVTDLIVEKGFLLKKDRVLPLATVERVSEYDIYLNIPSEDLKDYAEYSEVTVKEPAPDAGSRMGGAMNLNGSFAEPHIPMIRKRRRQGISAGRAVLDHRSEVENLNKVLGHVDHVIVDCDSDTISHVVVRRGLFADYRVLPIEMIEEVGDDIFVLLSSQEVEALPRYEPGSESEIVVEELVPERQKTEPLSLGADVATSNVAARVNQALAADPRTAGAVIEAIYDRGSLLLQGEVDRVETRAVAEEIARRQPGVHVVHNELVVPKKVAF